MKAHIRRMTRIDQRPASADASDVAKYISQVLELANGFLNTAELWQDLRSGKEAAQG